MPRVLMIARPALVDYGRASFALGFLAGLALAALVSFALRVPS